MAHLDQEFDVETLPEGRGSFDPIPAGWYTAQITSAELKATKDGTGQYIAIRYDVLGPSYEGRVVWGNLNIRNASAKAEEIGRQQLGELMRATGLSKVRDTDQLIGGTLEIKVKVAKSEEFGDKNEVQAFRAAGGSKPAASAVQPSSKSKSGGLPWAK